MSIQAHNKKKIVMVLFVQSIIFAFLFVVLDIMLWMFFPISFDTQSVEYVRTQTIPGLKNPIVYKHGKYGLRSLSTIDNVKQSNSIRILCLGASTTWQTTQETQDTWCGILETKLLEHYGNLDLKIQTMAYGRGGHRVSESALWIKEKFDEIEPDIVITLLGINDLARNGGKNYKYRSIEDIFSYHSQNSDREGSDRGIKYLWKKYSQIFRRVVYIRRNLRIKEKIKTGKVVEWHSKNLPNLRDKYRNYPHVEDLSRNPDPINEFRDTINWMITFFKKRKVQVIMLGQPVLWKESFKPGEFNSLWFGINTPKGPVRPSGGWLKREMARYNSVQQSLAFQASIDYINMDDKIPKTSDYYFDDCHYTDLGSMVVADNILPVLIHAIDDVALKRGLTWP